MTLMDLSPLSPRRRPLLLARAGAVVLAVGLLAGCGGDDGAGSAGPASAPTGTTGTPSTADADAPSTEAAEEAEEAEDVVITIEDFAYSLPDTVEPGAQIVVRNLDGVGHTVTADDGAAFDVVVGPGEEVTFTAPEEEGEHPFHCTPHPAMTATLVVEAEES